MTIVKLETTAAATASETETTLWAFVSVYVRRLRNLVGQKSTFRNFFYFLLASWAGIFSWECVCVCMLCIPGQRALKLVPEFQIVSASFKKKDIDLASCASSWIALALVSLLILKQI